MPFRHRISGITEADKVPETLVAGHNVEAEDAFPELALEQRVDPMSLWGAWPGEEPLEVLMALLD
jgi:hypothetical protein